MHIFVAQAHSHDSFIHSFVYLSFDYYSGLFASCDVTIKTGRQDINSKEEITLYMGNRTIRHIMNDSVSFPVFGKTGVYFYIFFVELFLLQNVHEYLGVTQEVYGWDGFYSYPYTYSGVSAGTQVHAMKIPILFDSQTMLTLALDQVEIDQYERGAHTSHDTASSSEID